MNAEQMFEELGYEKKEESEGVLLYISDFENSILFENKRVTITNLYCYGRITININCLLENAIHKQCKELGWLEEEKPEIKRETNYEHYKDEIIENCGFTFALVDGKPHKCACVNCNDCGFSTGHGCSEKVKEWLKSPYKKPTYKLNQFEYDLLKSYSDIYSFNAFNSLSGMKEKGYFKGIDDNKTIGDILDNCEVIK